MKERFCLNHNQKENPSQRPSLLLHSCCAPCSSSVLECLLEFFDVTVLYYNPNIFPESEFIKRQKEQERFCREFLPEKKIGFVSLPYDEREFEERIKGLEKEKEGGARCSVCFLLRLEKAAQYASENSFDYFTTTLSVSPLKDAKRLNEIGKKLGEKYGIAYLESDFKKKEGYKRSCEISREFNMYRQDFCGCRYSLIQRIMSSKGFIFDLDGTLMDTMGFYESFSNNVLLSFGKTPENDVREKVRSFTVQDACKYFKDEYSIEESVDFIYKRAGEMVQRLYESDAPLKEGVMEFLKASKSLGIKLSIATASPKEGIVLALKRLGIYDMFDCILTCPELGTTKREPLIYRECANRMGLSEKDVTVFEDAHHAIETAKKGGFRVVAVKEETELEFIDKILETADLYVNSMAELL